MRIKGVLFDMDGLMLDSEVLYEQASLEIMKEMGVEPSIEVIHSSIGMNEVTWTALVQQHYGPQFDIRRFGELCSQKMNIWYCEKAIPTKPGLFELLDYLREHDIACAVATSTRSDRATAIMKRVGIWPYMKGFAFGDMVENSKPAPDIFLMAAKSIGLPPEECMGLEDSFNGVRACRAAGLYTVMIPDLLKPDEEILKLTDGCLGDLGQVIPLLERLNAPKRKDSDLTV